MRILTAATVLALGMAAAPASAQDRAWVAVSGGIQAPASSSFSDTFDIQAYTETGHVTSKYPIKRGGLVAGSFGVRVWKQFGVGIAVTRSTSRETADVSAGIPHPFFDNQPRNISGTESVHHNETGAHLQLAWLLPLSPKIRVILSGGPSVLSVEQTLLTDIHYSETYPYDTATYTGAVTTKASRTATGFNAGADVAWMFSKNLGVGAMAQFARATAKLDAGSGRRISVDAGGAYIGAGIRASF